MEKKKIAPEAHHTFKKYLFDKDGPYTLRLHDGLKVRPTILTGPTKTRQDEKDDTDVNRIMANAKKTGVIKQLNRKGIYGDFSQLPQYKEMVETIAIAEEEFDRFPAKTRKRFNNNPHNLIEFLKDPENKAEGIILGLFEPEPTTTAKGKETKIDLPSEIETPPKNPPSADKGGEKPKQLDT